MVSFSSLASSAGAVLGGLVVCVTAFGTYRWLSKKTAFRTPSMKRVLTNTAVYACAGAAVSAGAIVLFGRTGWYAKVDTPIALLVTAVAGTTTALIPYRERGAKHTAWLVSAFSAGVVLTPLYASIPSNVIEASLLFSTGICASWAVIVRACSSQASLFLAGPLTLTALTYAVVEYGLAPDTVLHGLSAGRLSPYFYSGLAAATGWLVYRQYRIYSSVEQAQAYRELLLEANRSPATDATSVVPIDPTQSVTRPRIPAQLEDPINLALPVHVDLLLLTAACAVLGAADAAAIDPGKALRALMQDRITSAMAPTTSRIRERLRWGKKVADLGPPSRGLSTQRAVSSKDSAAALLPMNAVNATASPAAGTERTNPPAQSKSSDLSVPINPAAAESANAPALDAAPREATSGRSQ